MRKLALMVASALALGALPTAAHAGFDTSTVFSCVRNSDSTGYCYGSPIAFHNSANPGDVAQFMSSAPGYIYFSASVAGNSYACTFPSSSWTTAIQTSVLANRAYFFVSWNASAQCTYYYLYNTSAVP
jgi:hypothetical protein